MSGRVLAGGLPVASASINVQPGNYSGQTAADGTFALGGVAVGTGYEVRIIAGGYEPLVLANRTFVGGTNNLGDLTLTAISGTFVLKPLKPEINPTTSEVEEGGYAYRYYRVVNVATNKEQGGVIVQVRPAGGGTAIPQETVSHPGWAGAVAGVSDQGSGIVRLRIPASEVGSAGASRQFETVISGAVGPTFWVTVTPRTYALTWGQEVRGGVSGKINLFKEARLGGERGHGIKVVRNYPPNSQSEHIERLNAMRAELGVGVGLPVGGKASINNFTVGATASAGAGVYAELQHGFGYGFDPGATDAGIAMLRLYCLYADVADQALVMGPVISYVRSAIEPLFLDDVWLWSEAGAELGGYARFDATFVPLSAALFDLGASMQASGSREIAGRFKGRYEAPENVLEMSAGWTAHASASADIGLGFGHGGLLGDLDVSPVKNLLGDIGMSAGGSFQGGIEQWVTERAALDGSRPLEIELTTRVGGKASGFARLAEWNVAARSGEENAVWEFVLMQPVSSAQEWLRVASNVGLLEMLWQSGNTVLGNDFSRQVGTALFGARPYAEDLRYRHAVELIDEDRFQAGLEGTVILGLKIKVKYDTSRGRRVPLQSGKIRGGKLYPLATTGGTSAVPDNSLTIFNLQETWAAQATAPLTEAWNRFSQQVQATGQTVIQATTSAGQAILTAAQGAWQAGTDIVIDRWDALTGGGQALVSGKSRLTMMDGGTINLLYGIGGMYRFSADSNPTQPVTLQLSYQDEQIVGFAEEDLRVYRRDDENQKWELLGGAVDTVANTVTVSVTQLGVFALAPPLPTGTLNFTPSQTTVPADGTSTVTAEVGNLLLNNGSAAGDGWLYTVTATGMDIVTGDADAGTEGIQVDSAGGKVTIVFRAPASGGVGEFLVTSVYGDAAGQGSIAFSDTTPPPAPTGLIVTPGQSKLFVWWDPGPADVAHHRVYYRGDAAGPPWDGTAKVEGAPSPIDVSGESAILRGLELGTTYYVAVSAVDGSGNESPLCAAVGATTVESPPGSPFDVRSGGDAAGEYDVSWGLSEDDGFNDRDVDHYEVYRRVEGVGPRTKAADVPSGTSVFTDSVPGLPEGTEVWYDIVAVDTAGLRSAPGGAFAPADFDLDGVVGPTDFDLFAACAGGPSVAYIPDNLPDGCLLTVDAQGIIRSDFDRDGDVDTVDFATFQRCYSGDDNPADPNCGE
ncbi:MAG: hypothetical protein HY718_15380 [Planctomycetes bacterium]|nr:hypothetical protein [Planctomycetota bacterium]